MKPSVCTTRHICQCDSRLSLPLGTPGTANHPAALACLRCGTISPATQNASACPSGEIFTPDSVAWLARWPRLLLSEDNDFVCLPAAVRCTTLDELETVRRAAWNAQRHLPRGRRLNRAGWPMTPPPDSLPSAFSHYRVLWEAAGFTSATDLDTLLYWAIPAHTLVSPLALNALLQRGDLRQLLPGLAHSPVLHRRTVLCALAQEDASLVPVLRPHLQSWLQHHDRAADSPQKRALSPEAELCRDSLRAWQLARTSTSQPLPAHTAPSHDTVLSAAA